MLITSDAIVVATVVVGAGSSALVDLRTRRIPNGLTLGLTAVGLGLAASGASGLSVGASFGGLLVGLLLMLPGHLFGGTGGGDVKLLAALGSILGPHRVFSAFLYSAIVGGLLAITYAVARGRLHTTLRGTARLVTQPSTTRAEVARPAANNRFPYGPAIALGCVAAALGY